MPAGMFSNNTTLKVSTGGAGSTSSGTMFTTAANVVAFATIHGDFTIGGVGFTTTGPTVFYIGPSTTVARNAGTVVWTYCAFTNSP